MNLVQISSSVIFMSTISILTGGKLESCKNPNGICLPYYVIPVHYHIRLTHLYRPHLYQKFLNMKDEYAFFHFLGESSTTINIFQSTQYIKLNMLNLRIINRSNITMLRNSGITYTLKNYIEISKANLVKFYFSNILYPGLYTFKTEFAGQFTENSAKSFFKIFYTKGSSVT